MSEIYSQGFNFSSFLEKGVDPRTGQYTCVITIYETPSEARNCPPLKLALNYNPMSSKDNGLEKGWSFNLSSYQHRQRKPSLFVSTGEHFQVTERASDVSVDDQKLKSLVFKKLDNNDYQVIHKSGRIEVLSNYNDSFNTTVPITIHAANGRLLNLTWTLLGDQPRLVKIQEASQDLLTITYTDGPVHIDRNPGTAEASRFTLELKNDHLMGLELPLENEEEKPKAWHFTYETVNQITCLSTVTSPAGLQEEVRYKEDGHRLPKDAPYRTIPHVLSHAVRPGYQQPPIVTYYAFSNRNFLAFDGGYDWKNGEDNLYRMPDEYQYSSTVQVKDGPETKYIYNKFHLIVKTQRQQGTSQVTQSIIYHELPNSTFKDQPAQYQLPKTITTTYRDTMSNASRTTETNHSFDLWGNPEREIQENGIRTDYVYYPAVGEKATTTGEVCCPADPHGFQRYLKEKIITPATSVYTTPTCSVHYSFQALPTATGAYTKYLVAVQQMQSLENTRHLVKKEYTYIDKPNFRDHGRLKHQITSMFEQYPSKQDWTYE